MRSRVLGDEAQLRRSVSVMGGRYFTLVVGVSITLVVGSGVVISRSVTPAITLMFTVGVTPPPLAHAFFP